MAPDEAALAPATAPTPTPVPVPAPAAIHAAATSKYSNRVLLRTVLERSDGGLGLVGERLVVGGWVKSSKEEAKEALAAEDKARAAEHKDVSCAELLQTRIPLFRSIMKVFGGGSHPIRRRIEAPPSPPLSLAFLQISDGSCVASLLVCEFF